MNYFNTVVMHAPKKLRGILEKLFIYLHDEQSIEKDR